jgi:hypothetical protein
VVVASSVTGGAAVIVGSVAVTVVVVVAPLTLAVEAGGAERGEEMSRRESAHGRNVATVPSSG